VEAATAETYRTATARRISGSREIPNERIFHWRVEVRQLYTAARVRISCLCYQSNASFVSSPPLLLLLLLLLRWCE
jgi:hypothetical protein